MNKDSYIRLVVVSDTHDKYHGEFIVPEGDILIHCGDSTTRGDFFQLVAFNQWLGSLPHPTKLVIAGNHDVLFEKNPSFARSLITNAIYLQDSLIIVNGLRVYGSPWQPRFHDWAFNLDPPEIARKWDAIPEDLDILITHGPPYGILDKSSRDERAGCPELLKRVQEVRPKLHVFGHIHEGYGVEYKDGTLFVNASTCDSKYRPINSPIVIDTWLEEGVRNYILL